MTFFQMVDLSRENWHRISVSLKYRSDVVWPSVTVSQDVIEDSGVDLVGVAVRRGGTLDC